MSKKTKKPGYTAAQKLAVEFFTSNADECFTKFKTYEQFLKHIRSKGGASPVVSVWEPFEHRDGDWLGDHLEDLADDVGNAIKAAVKGVTQSVCAVLVAEELNL